MGSAVGPELLPPFDGERLRVLRREVEDPVECCFLDADEDVWRLESELARVNLASAAAALHVGWESYPIVSGAGKC